MNISCESHHNINLFVSDICKVTCFIGYFHELFSDALRLKQGLKSKLQNCNPLFLNALLAIYTLLVSVFSAYTNMLEKQLNRLSSSYF